MTSLLRVLRAHRPADEQEQRSLDRIAAHVEAGGDLYDRRRWDGHLTGSAFILDASRERLLLLYHRKLARWLQPGGHGEPGETEPLAVSMREALEESGIEGLVLHPTAPAPFDVDVHLIPARGEEQAHEHLDIRFLFVAPADAVLAPAEGESRQLAWVPLEEVAAVSDESVARAARKLLALRRLAGGRGSRAIPGATGLGLPVEEQVQLRRGGSGVFRHHARCREPVA